MESNKGIQGSGICEAHNLHKDIACHECADHPIFCAQCYCDHLPKVHHRKSARYVADEVAHGHKEIQCLESETCAAYSYSAEEYCSHLFDVHHKRTACYISEEISDCMHDIERNLDKVAREESKAQECRTEVAEARDKAMMRIHNAGNKVAEAERELENRRKELQGLEAEVKECAGKALDKLGTGSGDRIEEMRREMEKLAETKDIYAAMMDCRDLLAKSGGLRGVKVDEGVIQECSQSAGKMAGMCGENVVMDAKDRRIQELERMVRVITEERDEARRRISAMATATTMQGSVPPQNGRARDLSMATSAQTSGEEQKGEIAPPIHTGLYPYSGGNKAYVYNAATHKARMITLDCPPHLERESSSIIVKDYAYLIGGCHPVSAAVYALPILSEEGAAGCKVIPKASLKVARGCIGSAQYACNFIYALGGGDGNGVGSSCCEKYDISGDVWEPISSLNEAKLGVSACEMSRTIYSIGGHIGSSKCATVESLSIAREKEGWKVLRIENSDGNWTPRGACGCFKSDANVILIFGGLTEVWLRDQVFSMRVVDDSVATISFLDSRMKSRPMEGPPMFFCSNNCAFHNGEMYAMSFPSPDVHVYNLVTGEWRLVPWQGYWY